MSPEETPQRTECPSPDGELTLIFEGIGGKADHYTWPYREIKSLQYTSAVVDVILTNNYQHAIPLTRVVEIVNRGNSDDWLKARDEWMQEDHRFHTDDEEQPYCSMCTEIRRSNQAASLGIFGIGGY